MNTYFTQQLASQRIDEMHQAAARARFARQAHTQRTRRATPTFTLRRRRPCAA